MANIIRRNDGSERRLQQQRGPQRGALDPFEIMRQLAGFDPFEEWGFQPGQITRQQAFTPRFDVKETADSYVFEADLPGVKDSDVEIQLQGNRLTIGGKREAEEQKEEQGWYVLERSYGSFSRSFTLPDGVDLDHVDADIRDGVLMVRVAKRPETQPKKISLKSKAHGMVEKMKSAFGGEKKDADKPKA